MVSGDKKNKVLSQEVVGLFKTQDVGYVSMARNNVQKEVERRVVGTRGKGGRVIFVDDEAEQRRRLRKRIWVRTGRTGRTGMFAGMRGAAGVTARPASRQAAAEYWCLVSSREGVEYLSRCAGCQSGG